ncbi:MAG: HPr kinase/phosphatase C-terminal domain-containing protein [Sphingomonadales bacterium]|nr:HPr kinase/phosphatase C-terminal domain-containing protein [Sphingomonadales bacterium]MBD3774465.1 HPr kinase/phosphatase C-terminal domain-containing protein [Paracoccaceae bacterium]
MIRQASCVAIGGRAVLIEGAPGSGKSSLALALIDRGAMLVGDDGVTLEARGDRLLASPPPNIAGLLEIRNVGLVRLPTTTAPVALAITLSPDAPRFVDQAATITLAGIAIPAIMLFPDAATAPLRAEHALRLYGLSA